MATTSARRRTPAWRSRRTVRASGGPPSNRTAVPSGCWMSVASPWPTSRKRTVRLAGRPAGRGAPARSRRRGRARPAPPARRGGVAGMRRSAPASWAGSAPAGRARRARLRMNRTSDRHQRVGAQRPRPGCRAAAARLAPGSSANVAGEPAQVSPRAAPRPTRSRAMPADAGAARKLSQRAVQHARPHHERHSRQREQVGREARERDAVEVVGEQAAPWRGWPPG